MVPVLSTSIEYSKRSLSPHSIAEAPSTCMFAPSDTPASPHILAARQMLAEIYAISRYDGHPNLMAYKVIADNIYDSVIIK